MTFSFPTMRTIIILLVPIRNNTDKSNVRKTSQGNSEINDFWNLPYFEKYKIIFFVFSRIDAIDTDTIFIL